MKIIWLTTQFPSGEKDTKGRFIYRTVRELSRYYDISLICLYPILPPIIPMLKDLKNSKKIYKNWREKYPAKPVPPIDLDFNIIYGKYIRLPRGNFQFIEGWFSYFFIKKYLKKYIDQNTILHATWLFPEGDLANIISEKFNSPFVTTLMGSDVHFLIKNSKKWIKAQKIVNNSDFITSVSEQLYKDIAAKGIYIPEEKKQLTHTIYEFNNFAICERANVRNKLGIDLDCKIIFFAGTLRKIKNVNVLLAAFKNLTEELDNIKLVIAGNGVEEGRLKELAINLGINNLVNFAGGLNSEQIVNYYNSADVFCLPSKNEGLPNVIVEALLCGTPVVASKVGEIPYIVEDKKNGFTVTPNNVEDLTDALFNALKFNWDRAKLRDSVSFLSTNNVIKEYKNIYENIKIN